MAEIKIPKKLIEVALPLDIINKAAAREKSIRHGHPSTLHLWWARRPLATARAVIFAQMVNDPGYERHLGRGVNKEKAQKERERLFGIIERLVQWKNTNDEAVLAEARREIWKSWKETCELNKNHPESEKLFNPEKLPDFHDPFAGGGALPFEAQRLGLKSYASDLNPVAVVINKAMIEIPSIFSDLPPVGPHHVGQLKHSDSWRGAQGLAEDVRRYGAWVRNEAEKTLGDLYPKIEITDELAEDRSDLQAFVGESLTVIAWIWARTVKSPSPAFSHVDTPLVSSFILSNKKGNEAYVDTIVQGDNYYFKVRSGEIPSSAKNGTKVGRGGNFKCLLSGSPIPVSYIRESGKSGTMDQRLMAVVAEGPTGRVYLSPPKLHEDVACKLTPTWKPEIEINHNPRDIRTQLYGLTKYSDLFTARQLITLTTFSSLIADTVSKCKSDCVNAGMADDGKKLSQGGRGATAYGEAIGLYLALAVNKLADRGSTLCSWDASRSSTRNTFGRQALPMTWDFAEPNPLSSSTGNFMGGVDWAYNVLNEMRPTVDGYAEQCDAVTQSLSQSKVISTDPPYYDNIGYADLSDFFYVWLSYGLKEIFPDLFSEPVVPKKQELVATPYRHGSKNAAEAFFLNGMKKAIQSMARQAHPAFPITIYYAFKQSETKSGDGTSSTGWETFLQAILDAGLSITGTWPMRTELSNRMVGAGANALASSIALVCNKRLPTARTISRREFLRELNSVLPEALEQMTSNGINQSVAPVDLSQAIIGPGMAIFSKYSSVLEADGQAMSVRTAIKLINRFLAEDDFDHDTQFCLHWFESFGWSKGKFGEADVLARAKGTSVEGLKEGGIVESSGGNLRLLSPKELPANWNPQNDSRLSIWEILHHMIKSFTENGEVGAGAILAKTQHYTEAIRTLSYRLYTTCERKGWASDAGLYNALIVAWENIEYSAQSIGFSGTQISLFNEDSELEEKEMSTKTKARKKS